MTLRQYVEEALKTLPEEEMCSDEFHKLIESAVQNWLDDDSTCGVIARAMDSTPTAGNVSHHLVMWVEGKQ